MREYCRIHSSRHHGAVSRAKPELHKAWGYSIKGGKKERSAAHARDDDVHVDDMKEVMQFAVWLACDDVCCAVFTVEVS